MATPYVSAAMLTSRPAGLSWQAVPTLTASTDEQLAQLAQSCWTATSVVDSYALQSLRAVLNNEQGPGPGQPRVYVDRCTGVGTLITRRWPVRSVAAIQYAPAPPYGTFPPAWQAIPTGQWNIRTPMSRGVTPETGPSGGNVIDVSPGYFDWRYGRSGFNVSWSYLSGWPHCSLTGFAAEGATTVSVDDVTGWDGAVATVYDSTLTEMVTGLSGAAASPVVLPGAGGTVQAGPGTLTLAEPLTYGHQAGTVISALPQTVIYAAALAAAVEALQTIDAIAVQSVSGQTVNTAMLAQEYELLLDPYRKIC